MPSIDFRDLVGIPFLDCGESPEGASCVGVCRMALARMGAVLEPADLPLTEEAAAASCAAIQDRPEQSAWEFLGAAVGHARALGDLVMSRTSRGSHVAVIVDTDRRLAITACAATDRDGHVVRTGVTYVCATRRIRGVLGVYRLKQLAGGAA